MMTVHINVSSLLNGCDWVTANETWMERSFTRTGRSEELRSKRKQKEKLRSVLQSAHSYFNVCCRKCVCVCVCGSGRVFCRTNKLEPINTQTSVRFSPVATLEMSGFFPSKAVLESPSWALNRFDWWLVVPSLGATLSQLEFTCLYMDFSSLVIRLLIILWI